MGAGLNITPPRCALLKTWSTKKEQEKTSEVKRTNNRLFMRECKKVIKY